MANNSNFNRASTVFTLECVSVRSPRPHIVAFIGSNEMINEKTLSRLIIKFSWWKCVRGNKTPVVKNEKDQHFFFFFCEERSNLLIKYNFRKSIATRDCLTILEISRVQIFLVE